MQFYLFSFVAFVASKIFSLKLYVGTTTNKIIELRIVGQKTTDGGEEE